MANRHPTRATEVYADHAYTGGYDMTNVYGKKKPSDTSTGGAYVSSVEDTPTGPYSGSQYASPYSKPAAQPTTEDYAETRPPAASSGYGKHDNYGESRPSGYVEEEGRYSSHPGHGRRPDEYEAPEGRFGRPDHGRKPNYGGEYETEGHFPVQPHSQYGAPSHESEYSEGRIPGPRRTGWEQETGYGGYAGPAGGGGGIRPPHGHPGSQFTECEAARPPFGGHEGAHGHPGSEFTEHEAARPHFVGHQEVGEYGSGPFKHGNPHKEGEYNVRPQERFGRHNDADLLASETAGLSLGSDRHGGRDEGHRPKSDDSDSDSDDEKKKHHNKHDKKHDKHHHHRSKERY